MNPYKALYKSIYLLLGVLILFFSSIIYKQFVYQQSPEEICKKNTLLWIKNEYKTPFSNDKLQIVLKIQDKPLDTAQFFPILLPEKNEEYCAVSFTKIDVHDTMPESLKKQLEKTSKGITAILSAYDGQERIQVANMILNVQMYAPQNKAHVFNMDNVLADVMKNYSIDKKDNKLQIYLKTRITTEDYIVDIMELNGEKVASDSINLSF